MTEAIVSAIITSLISLIGTIIAIVASHKSARRQMQDDLRVQQAAMNVELTHIKEEQGRIRDDLKEHNHYAKLFSETVPVVQEQIKVINHRIKDLEDKLG